MENGWPIRENGIEVRDTVRWNLLQELKSASAPLVFSADGKRLAAMLTNGLAVWDLGDWSHRKLTDIRSEFNNLAFYSRWFGLVCGGSWPDWRMWFWDLRTGNVSAIGPIQGGPCSVSISPEGKWLVIGTDDGEVWFWDFATRQFVSRFQAHWAGFTAWPSRRRRTVGDRWK